jgi:hypothetical protein
MKSLTELSKLALVKYQRYCEGVKHHVLSWNQSPLDNYKFIVKNFTIENYHQMYLSRAVTDGCVESIRIMLRYRQVDPSIRSDIELRTASFHGNLDIVKILLNDKRVNPASYNNSTLITACEHGHTDIVKLLLKDSRVDASTNYCESLSIAIQNGRTDIVELLLQDEKIISFDEKYSNIL